MRKQNRRKAFTHPENCGCHHCLPGSSSLAPADGSAYLVTGYAMVPVKVRIEVKASNESEAGRLAEEMFARSPKKRSFIVPNSEDDTSVCDFRWSEAVRQNEGRSAVGGLTDQTHGSRGETDDSLRQQPPSAALTGCSTGQNRSERQ